MPRSPDNGTGFVGDRGPASALLANEAIEVRHALQERVVP
jgi:hypothetical protein